MTRTPARPAAVAAGLLVVLVLVALAVVGLHSHRLYAVQTGSMAPTIPARSLVVVDPGRYAVGQPITYEHAGALVTHRLVSVNPDGSLVTRGDANPSTDAWSVAPDAVIGGVVASVPELGYWLVYLRSPIGLLSVVLGLLLLYQIWSLLLRSDDDLAGAVGLGAIRPRSRQPAFGRVADLRPCLVADGVTGRPGRVFDWRETDDGWQALVRFTVVEDDRHTTVERWIAAGDVQPT